MLSSSGPCFDPDGRMFLKNVTYKYIFKVQINKFAQDTYHLEFLFSVWTIIISDMF